MVPDVTVNLYGDDYIIPRNDWFVRNSNTETCSVKFMHAKKKRFWLFGLNFFKNYYSVFDYEKYQVCFAPAVNGFKDYLDI